MIFGGGGCSSQEPQRWENCPHVRLVEWSESLEALKPVHEKLGEKIKSSTISFWPRVHVATLCHAQRGLGLGQAWGNSPLCAG